MPKRPEDDAAIDRLVLDEAEWQDLEAEHLKAATPAIRRAVARALAMVRQGFPSRARVKAASKLVALAIVRASRAPRSVIRETVAKQKGRRREVFGERSGKKLLVPKITPKLMEERIAAQREVKDG